MRHQTRTRPAWRSGAILIWLALMLTVLLGFVGLVVDVGILVAAHRQLQNAADAAAVAAATEKMYGASDGEAVGVGQSVVASFSDGVIPTPTAQIITPTTAADAFHVGPNYVKAIASAQVRTFFIQLLPGITAEHPVAASAVAGYEARAGGEGVAVLDHRAIPGLSVQGSAELFVNGKILVNSEGSGEDEDGNPVETGEPKYAATTANNPISSKGVRVVGGVDSRENYVHVDDPTQIALQCRQRHFPDPLANLTTPRAGVLGGISPAGLPAYRGGFPYTAQYPPLFVPGVAVDDDNHDYPDVPNEDLDATDPWPAGWATDDDHYYRGEVKVTSSNDPANPGVGPNDLDAQGRYKLDPQRLNRVRDIDINDDGARENVLVLHPGVYTSMDINGGRVALMPGIYVIQPPANAPQKIVDSLKIVAADPDTDIFWAKGVMFYVTGNNFNPESGEPDISKDSSKEPPARDPLASVAAVSINTALTMTPIDTSEYGYIYDQFGDTEIDVFDGMLFYQRRWNDAGVSITGNAQEGVLSGTIYARWSKVSISGQGTYDAQFIIGSLAVSGTGKVTVMYTGPGYGKAPRVYLVE